MNKIDSSNNNFHLTTINSKVNITDTNSIHLIDIKINACGEEILSSSFPETSVEFNTVKKFETLNDDEITDDIFNDLPLELNDDYDENLFDDRGESNEIIRLIEENKLEHQAINLEKNKLLDSDKINSIIQEINSENLEIKSENLEIKSENQEINSENQEINSENQEIKSENQEVNSENQKINSENLEINFKNQEINFKNQEINTVSEQKDLDNENIVGDLKGIDIHKLKAETAKTNNPTDILRSKANEVLANFMDSEYQLSTNENMESKLFALYEELQNSPNKEAELLGKLIEEAFKEGEILKIDPKTGLATPLTQAEKDEFKLVFREAYNQYLSSQNKVNTSLQEQQEVKSDKSVGKESTAQKTETFQIGVYHEKSVLFTKQEPINTIAKMVEIIIGKILLQKKEEIREARKQELNAEIIKEFIIKYAILHALIQENEIKKIQFKAELRQFILTNNYTPIKIFKLIVLSNLKTGMDVEELKLLLPGEHQIKPVLTKTVV